MSFYSTNINSTFTIGEDGKMALDLVYQDSDGSDISVYSNADNIEDLFNDVVDQIEEAMADEDDAAADIEERDMLMDKIDALEAKIATLEKRNAYLEQATKLPANKIEAGKVSDNTTKKDKDYIKDYSKLLDKLNNFNSVWGNSWFN